MADVIRKINYFSMQIPNRAGEAARLLKALRNTDVKLLAFTGFPNGKTSQVDFFPEKPADFRKAAKAIGLDIGKPKTGFLAQGKDRNGVIAGILDTLGRARINLTAIDAVSAPKRRFGAIFWVQPKDVAKAAKLLGAK